MKDLDSSADPADLSSASSPRVARTSLTRRRVLGLLGASAAGIVAVPGVHPQVPVREGEAWRPRVFDDHQLALVTELAELIIPATDTPGARGALGHQFIDWVVSTDTAEAREAFLAGLSWVDQDSSARFGKRFLALDAGQKHDLVSRIATAAESTVAAAAADPTIALGAAFFRDLKRRTIAGYYRSEIGMVDELGFAGNRYLREFRGCEHPEHHAWRPVGSSTNDDAR